MADLNYPEQPFLFPHEGWIASDLVERCTCYRRADGEIVKHGVSQLLSNSGFVYEEGELRHGLRHAVWRSYHDNGRIKSISQYSIGPPSPQWVIFHPNTFS